MQVLEYQRRLQQNYVQTRDCCKRLELELEHLRGHRATIDFESSRAAAAATQSLTSFAMLPIARSLSPAPAQLQIAAAVDDIGSTLPASATSGSAATAAVAAEGFAHVRSFTSPDFAELVLVTGADSPEQGPPLPPRNGHMTAAYTSNKLDAPRSSARKSSHGSSGDEFDVPVTGSSQLHQLQSHGHSFALPLVLDITTSSC